MTLSINEYAKSKLVSNAHLRRYLNVINCSCYRDKNYEIFHHFYEYKYKNNYYHEKTIIFKNGLELAEIEYEKTISKDGYIENKIFDCTCDDFFYITKFFSTHQKLICHFISDLWSLILRIGNSRVLLEHNKYSRSTSRYYYIIVLS
jgi:hypothetical protein